MKCLNRDCTNELSDFDLKRIDGIKFSWQRFCIDCRRYKQRIAYITCQMCKCDISYKVSDHNVMKIYCSECGYIRHRSRNIKRLTLNYSNKNN